MLYTGRDLGSQMEILAGMFRRSFVWGRELGIALAAALQGSGQPENPAPGRWKAFADVAGIPIPDADLAAISATLDRTAEATRRALSVDAGFTEPALLFSLQKRQP